MFDDLKFAFRQLLKNPGFTVVAVLTLALGIASLAGYKHLASDSSVPQHVSFPTEDGGKVYAHLYGSGKHGVLLAHGGRFNKESWTNQARVLVNAGVIFDGQCSGYGAERKRRINGAVTRDSDVES